MNLDDLHVEVNHINPIYTRLVDFTSFDMFYCIEAAADEQKKEHWYCKISQNTCFHL